MTASESMGAAVVAIVLLLISVPIISRLARGDDPRLRKLLSIALVLKLLCAPLQLFVFQHFYNGVADYNLYASGGATLANQFRSGNFALPPNVTGIGFIKLLTGIIYLFIGVNKVGGFVVFSWLAFLGLCFFYRAFRIGVPDGSKFRYAVLIFFMPSLLFWTSAIGKDAWMVLALGITALGAARLLNYKRGGLLFIALGIGATALDRPHVGLIAFAALGAAYVVRPARENASALAPIFKIAGLTVLAIGGVLLLTSSAGILGGKGLSSESVDQVLQSNSQQLSKIGKAAGGGSNVATHAPSPTQFPQDIVTVLFRPLPFEVHNLTGLADSLEGLVLMGIIFQSRGRLVSGFKTIRRRPYLLMAVLYSAVFIYLFAGIGNLGIIAREKVQLLPFFLVLLAVPPAPVRDKWSGRILAEGRPVR